MTPHLTDDAVAGLPLDAARAELLDELVSTPVAEARSVVEPASRQRPWLVPLAAAAAVATLVGVPTWLLSGPEQAREAQPAAAPRDWLVLDAPGWTVDHVSVSDGDSEVSFVRDGQQVEINLRDADARATYVEDRRHIDHPVVDPGTPTVLAGDAALMWAYDRDDHTAIGPVRGDVYAEVRGTGMGRRAYEQLLGRVSWTDRAGFERLLPESFVTGDEADDAIADMLVGIPLAPGAAVPTSRESDPYQLGADVAGQVVCGWVEEFERATAGGEQQAAQVAQANLRSSRHWQFLRDMDADGDYPEVVWEIAAQVVAGEVPSGYRQALGCP